MQSPFQKLKENESNKYKQKNYFSNWVLYSMITSSVLLGLYIARKRKRNTKLSFVNDKKPTLLLEAPIKVDVTDEILQKKYLDMWVQVQSKYLPIELVNDSFIRKEIMGKLRTWKLNNMSDSQIEENLNECFKSQRESA
jgi:hypothetical protein